MTDDSTTREEPPGALFQLHLAADGTLGLPYASPGLGEVLGVPVHELAADPPLIHRAVHDVDRPAYDRAGRDAAVQGHDFRWEGRIVRPDGTLRWVRITSQPERQPDGGTLWSAVVVDLTTRAQHSARALVGVRVDARDTAPVDRAGGGGDPTAILAHDIGTPLTAIAMAADLAGQVLDDPAVTAADLETELRRCLAIVRRNTDLLAFLRDDLLRNAAAGSDQVVAAPESVVLRVRLAAVTALAGDPSRLAVDCPPDLRCWVQPAHLDQMLLNLLANADKYAGGAVALRVAAVEGRVTLTVEDDGPGVPAAFHRRLFTPYARAERSTDLPGSGLGLSIVAELAHANDGTVHFAPRPGGGSCFTVTLPPAPSPVGHC